MAFDTGNVLLARDFAGGKAKWQIPGGIVQKHETLLDAARRVLLEETGYISDEITLFQLISEPTRPEGASVDFVYICTIGERPFRPISSKVNIAWHPVDKIRLHEFSKDHGLIFMMFRSYCHKPFELPLQTDFSSARQASIGDLFERV